MSIFTGIPGASEKVCPILGRHPVSSCTEKPWIPASQRLEFDPARIIPKRELWMHGHEDHVGPEGLRLIAQMGHIWRGKIEFRGGVGLRQALRYDGGNAAAVALVAAFVSLSHDVLRGNNVTFSLSPLYAQPGLMLRSSFVRASYSVLSVIVDASSVW
jgi:hypothetical protein